MNGISFPKVHFFNTESNISLSATVKWFFQSPIIPTNKISILMQFMMLTFMQTTDTEYIYLDIEIIVKFTSTSSCMLESDLNNSIMNIIQLTVLTQIQQIPKVKNLTTIKIIVHVNCFYSQMNGISFPAVHFSNTESNSSLSATVKWFFQSPISPAARNRSYTGRQLLRFYVSTKE